MALKHTTDDGVEFKGKRTQRSRGHERREAILRAALRIIARDGVRAVRHRAVAKEAQVPLAATTYYFKDINELIYDAFAYFAAEGDKLTARLEERSFAALAALTPQQRQDPQQRQYLVTRLTGLVVEHIRDQISNADNRMVENAFHMRALYDPELGAMLAAQRHVMREKIGRFLAALGLSEPGADTEAFLALILHLEYEALAARQRNEPEPELEPVLHNFVARLLLKPENNAV